MEPPQDRLLRAMRERDYYRHLACITAPPAARPLYIALASLHYELFSAADPAKDPLAGHMRAGWWRAALEEALNGTPRNQDILELTASLKEQYGDALNAEHLYAVIDAAPAFRDADAPADITAWKKLAADASGAWMLCAARTLFPQGEREIAYAEAASLVRGCAATVFGAVTGAHGRRALLPADIAAAHGLTSTHIIEKTRPRDTAKYLTELAGHIAAFGAEEEALFAALPRRAKKTLYPARVLARTAVRDVHKAANAHFELKENGALQRRGAGNAAYVFMRAFRDLHLPHRKKAHA